MKILVFTDTHGSKKAIKKIGEISDQAELILCLGDFTIFGQDQKEILRSINALKAPVFLIHGNHEDETQVREDCKSFDNIKFIHGQVKTLKHIDFIAWGGDGFSLSDKKFEKKFKTYKKNGKTILLTHGPPHKTMLDLILEEHCGNKSFTAFINKHKPEYALSGHIHENQGIKQIYDKTILLNPGPSGVFINL